MGLTDGINRPLDRLGSQMRRIHKNGAAQCDRFLPGEFARRRAARWRRGVRCSEYRIGEDPPTPIGRVCCSLIRSARGGPVRLEHLHSPRRSIGIRMPQPTAEVHVPLNARFRKGHVAPCSFPFWQGFLPRSSGAVRSGQTGEPWSMPARVPRRSDSKRLAEPAGDVLY